MATFFLRTSQYLITFISKREHDAEERTEKPQHDGDTHVNERDETS